MSSFTDFTGTLGWSESTSGVEDSRLIGWRSANMSNLMRLANSVVTGAMLPEVNRTV
jgi:hypothetical protein